MSARYQMGWAHEFSVGVSPLPVLPADPKLDPKPLTPSAPNEQGAPKPQHEPAESTERK